MFFDVFRRARSGKVGKSCAARRNARTPWEPVLMILNGCYMLSTVPWGAGSTGASGASPAPQASRCDRVVDVIACFGHNFGHIFDPRTAWGGVRDVRAMQEVFGASVKAREAKGCLQMGPDGAKMFQDIPRGDPKWPNLAPRWPKIGPRWPKMAPRWPNLAPRRPQDGPRWSKIAPRWPEDGPRWPQDGPTWPHDGPKMAQDGAR